MKVAGSLACLENIFVFNRAQHFPGMEKLFNRSDANVISVALKALKKTKAMRFVELANCLRKEARPKDLADVKKKHAKLIHFFSEVELFEVYRDGSHAVIRLSPFLEAAVDAHSFFLLRQSLASFV